MSLGVYPDVSLADARWKREEARRKVAAGVDPGEQREAEAIALVETTENTFEAVARDWYPTIAATLTLLIGVVRPSRNLPT